MKWLLVSLIVCPLVASAGSVYLCKAYSGCTFWASTHCNQNSDLIEDIVSVPDGMPFDQQVNLAEQYRQRKASSSSNGGAVTSTTTTTPTSSGPSRAEECKALDAQATQYDSMARQPQSGQMQDWIKGEKKKVRDRQFAMRC